MKEVQCLFDLGFEFAERPQMQDLVVIVPAQPPGYPVAADRAQHSPRYGGPKSDIRRADYTAQRDQQRKSRDQDRDTCERFRKSHPERDGKTPIGIGACGAGHPEAGVIDEPVQQIGKHGVAIARPRLRHQSASWHNFDKISNGLAAISGVTRCGISSCRVQLSGATPLVYLTGFDGPRP